MKNAVEAYLKEMHEIRSTGGAVDETSYYGPLCNLLNEVGKTLKPKVKCISQLKNTGAGNPDFGLYSTSQFKKSKDAEPLPGQLPERGVIEAKPVSDDSLKTANSKQVSKYWKRYSQILVTNYRDFIFVGRDEDENPVILEKFSLAEDERSFWTAAIHARKTADEKGGSFIEYLQRVMQYSAALKNPADLAWFLASYAREARMRIEKATDLPGLSMLRKGLEDALGMQFSGDEGEHFFRAVLIETLFYGIFSSWVIWSRTHKKREHTFNWHEAAWNLHVPMIAGLFDQIATPHRLQPLGIDKVLDWTGGVLNRVDRKEFFRQFEEEHAVQYFYEPFLEAYDPALRKQLGVWYTPPEIVQYQVERIDTVLREELDIADGLADENVVVLDPCCGTGAYLVEVLKKIHRTLEAKGGDAMTAQQLKKAATKRIFGFEILPAPFVISHLQLGLLLRELGAPLSDKNHERAGVYLTNALTGWEPPKEPKDQLEFTFPELKDEKDAAEKVKREAPILVILGNPPYNAFAGTSPEEEGGLVDAYKEGLREKWKILAGRGVHDLYSRFFRIAERRVNKSGKGVVSFISNSSWITDPCYVVLRECLLESFDKIWIENLHGDRTISEYAPDGKTSETIFAIPGFSVGIKQGVATSLWVKKENQKNKTADVYYRNDINAAKATQRRKQLLNTLNETNFQKKYKKFVPEARDRYLLKPLSVQEALYTWPKLTDLSEIKPFPGVDESRAGSFIDIERDVLSYRIGKYCDPNTGWDELKAIVPRLIKNSQRFNAKDAREKIIQNEGYKENNVCKHVSRPFDIRWCYHTTVRPIWGEPRPALREQYWTGNSFIISRLNCKASPEGFPVFYTQGLLDKQTISRNPGAIPIYLKIQKKKSRDDDGITGSMFGDDCSSEKIKANLSDKSRAYLKKLGFSDPDKNRDVAELIWMHSLAIGYSGAYLEENADGIRQDWPRIPLPDSKKVLLLSAALGKQATSLLDTEAAVDGVTTGTPAKELSCIGLISRVGGGSVNPDSGELDVTAGWGHEGKGGVCMPGKGNLVTRPYSDEELKAIPLAQRVLLGEETCDVYLNEKVFIKNVPANVWNYYIGGYQVIKKWLSYREKSLLGRGLTMEEMQYIREMTRRLSALVLMGPELDNNYRSVTTNVFNWQE